jgi:flagellar motor switch protein FliN/FliY
MATTQATLENTAQALAAELALAWGTKLGGPAGLTPAAAGPLTGWLITVAAGGGAPGTVTVCFDPTAATAAARAALKLDADPADDAVSELLKEVVTQSADAFLKKSGPAGVTLGAAAIARGSAPADAAVFDLEIGGKAVGKVAVSVEPAAEAAPVAAPTNSRRLEAVLDVDLPLVVRFGRATMVLRTLAVLGPGSVIDMGRSPDEPVELLVGERVIARGEVVVVGGNYGVRITELTTSQPVDSELEARTA